VVTLLPGILSVDGPHAGRTIGAAAIACALAGIGWIEIAGRARWPPGALAVPLVAAAALNAWTYFVAMPTDPRVWGSFYPVETRMGVFVRRLAGERGQTRLRDVLVPGDVARSEVFRYLSDGLVVGAYEEDRMPETPAGALVLVPADPAAPARAASPWPDGQGVVAAQGPPFPGLAIPSFTAFRRLLP
jgi:hypothetical protein